MTDQQTFNRLVADIDYFWSNLYHQIEKVKAQLPQFSGELPIYTIQSNDSYDKISKQFFEAANSGGASYDTRIANYYTNQLKPVNHNAALHQGEQLLIPFPDATWLLKPKDTYQALATGRPIFQIVANFSVVSDAYYNQFRQSLFEKYQTTTVPAQKSELEKLIPALMKDVLEVINVEWNRITDLFAAGSKSKEPVIPENTLSALRLVVKAAAESVGISLKTDHIYIRPGTEYSMEFFNYAQETAVLRLPWYAINTPWEWSVIWHELAGYKVRELKAQDKKRFSTQFYAAFLSLTDAQQQDSQNDAWSEDWYEELYEDAFSVYEFGQDFITIFDNILTRYPNIIRDNNLAQSPKRHPPKSIRLQLARLLLNANNGGSPLEKAIAKQIAKVRLPTIHSNSFAPYTYNDAGDWNTLSVETIAKINNEPGNLTNDVSERVRKAIAGSMKRKIELDYSYQGQAPEAAILTDYKLSVDINILIAFCFFDEDFNAKPESIPQNTPFYYRWGVKISQTWGYVKTQFGW